MLIESQKSSNIFQYTIHKYNLGGFLLRKRERERGKEGERERGRVVRDGWIGNSFSINMLYLFSNKALFPSRLLPLLSLLFSFNILPFSPLLKWTFLPEWIFIGAMLLQLFLLPTLSLVSLFQFSNVQT